MTETSTPTGAQAHHQSVLDQGRFLIQHCPDCQKHVYFPRELCPHCGAAPLNWVAPTGHGTVYAVTTVRRKAEAGGDFNVCLVDLDEGVRLMSRVDNLAPQAVRIGQRVKARVQVNEGRGLVVFDAEKGDAA
ncbi:DNA-binding protein [Hydrogenophaga crassostreae]|uniref:DNA-binding protein n=1 Tax=Hydrogenophaga crassostreae TaxID=1763535 RepID=A0A163CQ63_9BURK|nr:OB-fold domain-containing protein [Hydrogenophaga crassostreae]AOW13888.1 DNA-binding protein [Hydrogenophaga crassostreae]OAD44151.1 DNA-binding protein [Hydrogenophaga crassostreae]